MAVCFEACLPRDGGWKSTGIRAVREQGNTMIRCTKYHIRGRVQGVCFRASAVEQARRLGVTGWVRNTADGEVELLACGDHQQLRLLAAWLWDGPPMARVDEVTSELVEGEPLPGFTVR